MHYCATVSASNFQVLICSGWRDSTLRTFIRILAGPARTCVWYYITEDITRISTTAAVSFSVAVRRARSTLVISSDVHPSDVHPSPQRCYHFGHHASRRPAAVQAAGEAPYRYTYKTDDNGNAMFHKKLEFQRYPPKKICTARYEHKSSIFFFNFS